MSLPVLDATDQRILGSLLEKQHTVPASYPLTLNALRTACNQTSSREPVTDYDEKTLTDALKGLRDRRLVRVVWAEKGSRTLKYHQLLDAELALADDERALLTVLLLRGPQSPGELRTRTERLHPFADKDAVAACLARLAAASPPLVRELPLQRGQQDRRWVHLLGPVAAGAPAADAPADREAVLAGGAAARDAAVLAAYDAAAAAYSEALIDELVGKPFDVWILERIAAEADGPVMDLGCGPGQIMAFLADTGIEVHGLDGSAAMVEQARANFPDLDVAVGRFHQLLRPRNAAAWGAVVAWYAFVHLAPSELAPTMAGVAATLRPGGTLALALHLGEGIVHADTLCGVEVDLDVVTHDRDQVLAAVGEAGLEVAEWYVRSPYPDEAQTTRLYVLARRPA